MVNKSKNWHTEEVAKNPNTSPDILRKILEKGKSDWISWYDAYNPNCPPLAKIKWKKIIAHELTAEEEKTMERMMDYEILEVF